MKKIKDSNMDASQLRQSAEEVLATQAAATTDRSLDDKRLLHELQVHQIELELLNENLRHAQSELEKSWARYYDLYELAPVGYLSLNDRDLILESNRTAANLLGLARKGMIKFPLPHFIFADDQDVYYSHRKRLLETGKAQIFELRLVRQDGLPVWVRVEMNRTLDLEASPIMRVVLSDINEQRANDEYLRQAAAMFEASREGVMVTDASR